MRLSFPDKGEEYRRVKQGISCGCLNRLPSRPDWGGISQMPRLINCQSETTTCAGGG